ncbi:MAG: DUF2889 domain-containing protein [Candidatus Methylomirabilia bacterium]
MSDQPVHVRTIRVEVRKVSDDEVEVQGAVLDERPQGARWFGEERGTEIHNMTVTFRVRYPDFTITQASGSMTTHPYTICPEAVLPLRQLVGLSVSRGFSRAVQERLGREKGCAHLTALILSMAPVAKQGVGAAFRADSRVPTDEADLWFVNSCQAWRQNGPLHTVLKRRDREGFRALSARTPKATPPADS